MSLAGCSSGVFKAVKLLYSDSHQPSATENPISEKIEDKPSITCETGWILP